MAPESYKKRFIEMGYDEGTAARYGMIENIDDNFGTLMKNLNKWKLTQFDFGLAVSTDNYKNMSYEQLMQLDELISKLQES